jgi:DMSO/TMAO reductase YedYZ molybdopterin-dependent catalytic subunit
MGIFSNNSDRKMLEARMREQGRLPPGQVATLKWPVLHLGDIPRFDPDTWDFRTAGWVKKLLRLTWDDFMALPHVEVTADFHCVTRWSRFDNHWEGVPFRAIYDLTEPLVSASHVLVRSERDYTTNVPLCDLMEPTVLFAPRHDGKPLEPEHGGPLRLVVPKLYGWKSAKWVRSLEFLTSDEAGYWERNGYHMYGDPWKEQRFDTD